MKRVTARITHDRTKRKDTALRRGSGNGAPEARQQRGSRGQAKHFSLSFDPEQNLSDLAEIVEYRAQRRAGLIDSLRLELFRVDRHTTVFGYLIRA